MDISIFDVVGPVMLGPSSSATAGMMRIGAAARQLLTGEPKNVEILFHEHNSHFSGCRSHLGIAGGLMGYATDDPRFPHAFEEAKKLGMKFTIGSFPASESRDILRVRLNVESDTGARLRLAAVSSGGGNIVLETVDGVPVAMNNYDGHLCVWSEGDVSRELAAAAPELTFQGGAGEQGFFRYAPCAACPEPTKAAIRAIPGVKRVKAAEPFFEGGNTGNSPLFKDFSEILAFCAREDVTVAEAMIRYEENRSGMGREYILNRMAHQWEIMKKSVAAGIAGTARPLYGLDDGLNGRRMLEAVEAKKTLSGSVVGKAVAYGLGVMEYAMAMGCITAAPTCGSSGIMPGCLVSLQEHYGFTDEQIIEALFASTSIGVIMSFDGVRFSGVAAGCQGEMTVSAAMAAQAVACLGGGDARQIGDAASFAVKGLLGLVCDPIGCVEVPCIKRNAEAIGATFAAADMALSGIRSFITADVSSFALKDVQDHLPEHLRGGGGGTACTPAACRAFAEIDRKDREYMEQNL